MKIYYKTKIIINGIFPLVNFKIDNFTEKTGIYNEKAIDPKNDDYLFYSSGFLFKGAYSCVEKEGNFYEYFENDILFEKTISDDLSKKDLQKLIMDEQIEKVSMIEKKLRLISGYGISLPVFKTTIYNSQKKILTYVGYINWNITSLSAKDYNSYQKEKLEQRLQFHITDSAIKELEKKNERFKRALYFYNNSFNSFDIGIRFTLLFSSLEALFNITGENITEEVAKFSSRIIYLSSKERDKAKYKIKNYYNERSKFIHGNNYDITTEIENNLREYVREILFIYWNISTTYNLYEPEEIKKLILKTNRDNLNIQVQLFIKYLRTSPKDFKILYNKLRTNFLNKDFKVLNNDNLIIK